MATWLWCGASAAWLVLMTVLSHQRGEQTSRVSETLARDLEFLLPGPDREMLNAALRKTAHVVVFGVLTVLTGRALGSGGLAAPAPGQLAALAVWCWLDEATKPLIPGRHFSWLDVGLNLLGVALGAALLAL